MANVSVFCFLASYAVALGADAGRLWGKTVALRWVAWAAAAAGLFAHSWFLATRHGGDLAGGWGPRGWILALSWLGAAYYVVATGVERRSALGVFLWPVVLGLVACSYAVGTEPIRLWGEAPTPPGRFFGLLHAALLLGGLVGVLAGVVTSAMYLVQHRRLRAGRFRADAVPLFSLERLDRWNRTAAAVAVPLLGLGVLIGFGLIFAGGEGAVRGLLDPVILGTAAGVLLTAAALGGVVARRTEPGRGIAVRTLLACGFGLVTVIGLQVLSAEAGGWLASWHGGGAAGAPR